MGYAFNDLEGLRIAVEMEKRGELFYTRASRISRNPETVALLQALAREESQHARDFQELYDRECDGKAQRDGSRSCAESYNPETSAYLAAIAADIIFPGGLRGLADVGFDDPAAVLRAAIASEKDSILFYSELGGFAHDAHAREVFEAIAAQERGHMVRLLNRLESVVGREER